MSLQATTTVEASADVSLRVPRGGSEDLQSGVTGVLAAVEAVTEVTVSRVTSVRPGYTDIRVDADITATVAVPEDADPAPAVATRLTDGFGINEVNQVDGVDPV
jgi:hypothetical protein